MKDQHIAKLESHLERLIEGAFSNIFSKKIRAQDIALRLARAMEDGLQAAQGEDHRPLAPDYYRIYTRPDVTALLLEKHPDLLNTLAGHMTDLATRAGYRLNKNPEMELHGDERLDGGELVVVAEHSDKAQVETIAMQRVASPVSERPLNPQLVIDGDRVINLEQDIVNIGRSLDNHIVLDSPHVSRHHVQLRLRFGAYTLFDLSSQAGTFINDIRIKEHRLQSGDVLRIGNVQMIYADDTPRADTDTSLIRAVDL